MRVDFDTRNLAFWTDDLGEEGGIVAGAGSDMDDVLSAREPELIKQAGPKTGLPVIQSLLLVDGDQNVMIEMRRIGSFRRPIIRHPHRAQETPWARAGELLASDCGESLDNGGRLHPSGMPQFFGEPPPGGFHAIIHQLGPSTTNQFGEPATLFRSDALWLPCLGSG